MKSPSVSYHCETETASTHNAIDSGVFAVASLCALLARLCFERKLGCSILPHRSPVASSLTFVLNKYLAEEDAMKTKGEHSHCSIHSEAVWL